MASSLKFKEYLLEIYSRQPTQAYVRPILCAPSSQESDLQPDDDDGDEISQCFVFKIMFSMTAQMTL